MKAPLLVELFTEELPPKALNELGNAFASGIASGLKKRGILEDREQYSVYATPRRLAVLFPSALKKALDEPIEEKLMPLAVARGPNGASPALEKKLSTLGRGHLAKFFPDGHDGPDAFVIKKDGKAEFVYLKTLALGQPIERALDESLEETIDHLPIPKVMTYQLSDGITSVKFVRPAHGLVALHGEEIVNITALGLAANRVTHGHRFLGTADITLNSAADYETALRTKGLVIANFDERRKTIEHLLNSKAAELNANLGDYSNLLNEVTALVEWPWVYDASFDQEFLAVPQECLILTMQTNQKYFPLFDGTGRLTNRFLIVSNMQVADPIHIISGNQRVIRPRLEDARFFYNQDRKEGLETRVSRLANVVYHNKVGSQLERVERIKALADAIAQKLGCDPTLAARAAWLSKADLSTGMVGEFPELQGIMGRYYAIHDQEHPDVARAIEEHYKPKYAGDSLPQGAIAISVALADKIFAISAFFAVQERPTGEKDPLGLRRQALGVIRILVENKLGLDLIWMIRQALLALNDKSLSKSTETELYRQHRERTQNSSGLQAFGFVTSNFPFSESTINETHEFFLDRLRTYLKDAGFTTNEIESVLISKPAQLDLVIPRLTAVRIFSKLPEAEALISANKRIRNILKQANTSFDGIAKPSLLKENVEITLFQEIRNVRGVVETFFSSRQYEESLLALAKLRPFVDKFFDDVMVNAEDPDVRQNRLRLLGELDHIMNLVADISKLAA